jgi:hypothetical protein
MKTYQINIIAFIIFLIFFGCVPKETKEKPIEIVKPKVILAWGESRQDWTNHLVKEIDSKEWSPNIKNHCKKIEFKECLAQAISIMAKYESGFKPETSYVESFKGQDGKNIVSRGLFQISISSSNQSAYKCETKTIEQLYDPKFNISCMVKIVNFWLNKDLVFFGGEKLGLGRYHSTGRASSKSNAKILKYLEAY